MPHEDLRQTIEAILWRPQNGAKWNRHLVENLWGGLKQWRAIATRYEKTARSFLSVFSLAATCDWLRRWKGLSSARMCLTLG